MINKAVLKYHLQDNATNFPASCIVRPDGPRDTADEIISRQVPERFHAFKVSGDDSTMRTAL